MKTILIHLFVCIAVLSSAHAQDFFEIKNGPSANHLLTGNSNEFDELKVLVPMGFNLGMYFRKPSLYPPVALFFECTDPDTGGSNLDTYKDKSAIYHATVTELNQRLNWVSDEDLVRKKYSIELDRELAVALHRVWCKFALQVAYPKTQSAGGLDGTTYYFAAIVPGLDIDSPIAEGKTGSFEMGSIPKDMVEFADTLIEFVKAEEPLSRENHTRMLHDLTRLEGKIDAQQGSTGQPATRSKSKSEGVDKPQPEAEEPSR